DYVLVCRNIEDEQESESHKKQVAFIQQLENKGFQIASLLCNTSKMFVLNWPRESFSKCEQISYADACHVLISPYIMILSSRIRVAHFILFNTYLNNGEGLKDLLHEHVFETTFSLHEEEKQKELREKWARWTACFQWQPIDDVRNYLGEKVALYFLWLGWYTTLLIPAAILGMVVFLNGLAFFDNNPVISEVCDANTMMCPLCDKKCPVWQLSETCTYAKVTHLFDNEGTVFFAMFMAVWATVFLEFWKRHRAEYVCKWKVFNWCEEEEELILDVVDNPSCQPQPYLHSYLRSTLVLILVTLMLVLIIGLAQALVVFRVVATVFLALTHNVLISLFQVNSNNNFFETTLWLMVNRKVALYLCNLEKTRSFAATETSFTVKMFTFQFFTLFSSLIYVAFFLGRINGRPGNYVRIAGKWRLEEVSSPPCAAPLKLSVAWLVFCRRSRAEKPHLQIWAPLQPPRLASSCVHLICSRQWCVLGPCSGQSEEVLVAPYRRVSSDKSRLVSVAVLQFSFTTIFVAAFPLAPLLALLNNIIEIRLDAIKMVSLERRLVPIKTNNIGVWYNVLKAVGVLAVIANGLVIGITSDFIPRLVYKYRYGPCANGTATHLHCMTGYINNTLSTVTVKYCTLSAPQTELRPSPASSTLSCKKPYLDCFLPALFLSVQHIAVIFKFIAAWFVPDVPLKVVNARLEDKLQRLKQELRCVQR
uniref:Anoctamin n=1 Tax=Lepisosteus oculatus TaxID=7918 RepID=W5MI16_LEPOC